MYRNTTSPGELGWTQGSLSSGRVIATLGVVLAVLLGVLATGPSPASATGDSFSVIAAVTVGTNPRGVAVSPNGSRVYVTNLDSNSVSVINTSNNTAVATVAVGANPRGVAVSPNGSRVYVTNAGEDSVSVINTSNNTVIDTVTVGSGPRGVAVSPNGSRVYVAIADSNSVSVIYT